MKVLVIATCQDNNLPFNVKSKYEVGQEIFRVELDVPANVTEGWIKTQAHLKSPRDTGLRGELVGYQIVQLD